MTKRPVAVTMTALLLIASGVIGIGGHFGQFVPPRLFQVENLLMLAVRLLAIVCGVFLMLRQNWARWVAVAWIAFHVVISYGDLQKFAFHIVIFLAFVYLLFRSDSKPYFGQAA